jgi:hypothetical protein
LYICWTLFYSIALLTTVNSPHVDPPPMTHMCTITVRFSSFTPYEFVSFNKKKKTSICWPVYSKGWYHSYKVQRSQKATLQNWNPNKLPWPGPGQMLLPETGVYRNYEFPRERLWKKSLVYLSTGRNRTLWEQRWTAITCGNVVAEKFAWSD